MGESLGICQVKKKRKKDLRGVYKKEKNKICGKG